MSRRACLLLLAATLIAPGAARAEEEMGIWFNWPSCPDNPWRYYGSIDMNCAPCGPLPSKRELRAHLAAAPRAPSAPPSAPPCSFGEQGIWFNWPTCPYNPWRCYGSTEFDCAPQGPLPPKVPHRFRHASGAGTADDCPVCNNRMARAEAALASAPSPIRKTSVFNIFRPAARPAKAARSAADKSAASEASPSEASDEPSL